MKENEGKTEARDIGCRKVPEKYFFADKKTLSFAFSFRFRLSIWQQTARDSSAGSKISVF